ncbi:2-oxoacid:acceptor oxidoreductase family protein [Thermogutta sp.]|jgi:pyruvate ferredoxin oxidoreductase gamma subunit|uniref:2-oxoacid:acceptor oxidoreductase family protein n=1 Tax=Thermogutta sp. TaxID=1962930 RepID=UPI0032206331
MIIRIRFHGRGGQAMKTAGRVVGTSAFLEGFKAQDSPMYGPERRGAPVASFLRISDEEIGERGYVWSPDLIAVADPTLIEDPRAKVLDGLRENAAAFINVPSLTNLVVDGLTRVTNYDVTGAALRILGRAVLSSGVAGSVVKLLPISASSLEEAVKIEMEDIGLKEREIDLNVKLALECYEGTPKVPIEYATTEELEEFRAVALEQHPPEISTALIRNVGNTIYQKTGNWRISRPEIDYQKCTRCGVCFDYCPEAAISLVGPDRRPVIDYDQCKGCLICYNECPVKGAIRVVKEELVEKLAKGVTI